MVFKGDFSEVSEVNRSVMRPGIIYALDRYSGSRVRARDLDSRSENKRIGRVLGALDSAGLADTVGVKSSYTVYEIDAGLDGENGEKCLNMALGEAEKSFDKVIQKALSRRGRDEDAVVEDVLTYGVCVDDSGSGVDELQVLRDYSDFTVNFLEDIGFVRDLDRSELLADDEDIQYLEQNIHVLL